ncbi:ribosomal protein S5 domain 2-type protein [Polychytrium aggregatum]|uniref:ribosomal protein S5 domain 2-type protein n=1 Tax=Polychytrium aggregatum TaxID=110093 RepID=UPI0022FDF659|nr:ribosomal protein S5 domain 2-type protein [Polychytrium aggregatum]KAI9207725.1 ribosomal protein S5 domain 2-type protein [Polychytrium aggregatum]
MSLLAPVERAYILDGVECDIRADGRNRLDARHLTLETGMITQASGSCRVSVDGGTDVLVGIKVEIETIDPNPEGDAEVSAFDETAETIDEDRRDKGRIVCSVECSPSLSAVLSQRQVEDLCIEYSQYMTRLLNSPEGGLDLKALCIIPGSTCFVVYIDVLILDYGGNLLDIIFLATRGAFHNTRMVKATAEQLDGQVAFDVSEEECEVVRGWENLPIVVTLSKIGRRHILDASPLEELCAEARVYVAVNERGRICSIQKSGEGGIEPRGLSDMVQTAKQLAPGVFKKVGNVLAEEARRIQDGQTPIGYYN